MTSYVILALLAALPVGSSRATVRAIPYKSPPPCSIWVLGFGTPRQEHVEGLLTGRTFVLEGTIKYDHPAGETLQCHGWMSEKGTK